MKKQYIKPAMCHYEMAKPQILAGSVNVKARVGISSFRTDDDDWTNEDGSTSAKKYSFWE